MRYKHTATTNKTGTTWPQTGTHSHTHTHTQTRKHEPLDTWLVASGRRAAQIANGTNSGDNGTCRGIDIANPTGEREELIGKLLI